MFWEIFLEGLFLQASLILALGAQNLFVLESGLRRQHHWLVAAICIVCDLVLIAIGVLGVANVLASLPILQKIFGVLGVGFLGYYGTLKLKEAIKPPPVDSSAAVVPSRRQAVWATLGFTLLNPHVYLDTIILLGGFAAKLPSASARLAFATGAGTTSAIWFVLLAGASAACSRFLRNRTGMRLVSLVSGLILLALAVKLGLEIF